MTGYLETRDKALIAMLRRLPEHKAVEVITPQPSVAGESAAVEPEPVSIIKPVLELSGLSWHEIQKLGSEKGVLKTGMGREAIEQALRELA